MDKPLDNGVADIFIAEPERVTTCTSSKYNKSILTFYALCVSMKSGRQLVATCQLFFQATRYKLTQASNQITLMKNPKPVVQQFKDLLKKIKEITQSWVQLKRNGDRYLPTGYHQACPIYRIDLLHLSSFIRSLQLLRICYQGIFKSSTLLQSLLLEFIYFRRTPVQLSLSKRTQNVCSSLPSRPICQISCLYPACFFLLHHKPLISLYTWVVKILKMFDR